MPRSAPNAPPAVALQISPVRGTVLAFDFGARRVGVAVGDLETRSAHPLAVIAAEGQARFAEIRRLVTEWQPCAMVVGVPARDGETHPLAPRAERFARQLEGRFGLPVARVDESYSSVEAEGRLRAAAGARRAAAAARARSLDGHAAQLLLEQYFSERES